MKALVCLLITVLAILQIEAAEPGGLYLRAVVDEQTNGAVQMTQEGGQIVFVSPSSIITPEDVDSATVMGGDSVSINFELKPSGQTKLGDATRAMIGKRLAIIFDGKLLSSPVIASEFSTGVQVKGNFTQESADAVVERIKANRKG